MEFTDAPVVLTPPPSRAGPLDTVSEYEEIESNFIHFYRSASISSALRDINSDEGMEHFTEVDVQDADMREA
ncbi:unnamed protein product [Dracunculus medinensis]|uniref:Vps4_C domain-containing protein n=1 Tax=Dracunculus medinensis TaxID=318479 RepID=A0A0N4U4A8_DRAME|nr:unnamed protein product [Dracunculus medinensis]